jgi:penicillin-binding protein 1A
MALPIWGYFFSKAYSDQSLGLQKEATFIQPESMNMETNMDYENFSEKFKETEDAENANEGSGNSEDFFGEGSMETSAEMNAIEDQIIEEAKKDKRPSAEPGKNNSKAALPQEDKKIGNKKP